MKKIDFGRHVFGLAGILFGLITLVWHDFSLWQRLPLADGNGRIFLAYVAGVIEIFGGIALQSRKTARLGAIVLGGTYLVFTLLCISRIAAQPLVYDHWGNFFEDFSQVAGALIIFAIFSDISPENSARLVGAGYIFFAVCVVSFTLEQLFYLKATAEFVPKWIPPGQMFWAIATTIAFALAAVSLLTGYLALLASQLTTAMIVGFGLLVWLPAPLGNPHSLTNWAGNAQNLSIAGAAWIVADFLNNRSRRARPELLPTPAPASLEEAGLRPATGTAE